MANQVFVKNDAGIRKLLQSDECLQVMVSYAQNYEGEKIPFVGFDRAKCFVKQEDKKNDRSGN